MLSNLLLFYFFGLAFCKELVPVIIWGKYDKPSTDDAIRGLTQLRSFQFSQLLHKLTVKRPHILLFAEENLSVEDFSWRNDEDSSSFPNLSNISLTMKDFLYLPSVESPVSVFHQLTHHGYSFSTYDQDSSPVLSVPCILTVPLPEPGPKDTRPMLLRTHDDYMARVAKAAIEKYKSVLVAYTGRHASFVEPSSTRHRREADEKEEYDSEIVMTDSDKTIFLVAAAPIEFWQGENVTNLTRVTYASKDNKGDTIILDVKFKEEAISFDFTFNAGENRAWQLEDIRVEGANVIMTSKTFIGAPDRYSFFCARDITFRGRSDNKEFVLTLRNLQTQPRVVNNAFGPASDCVPYFTAQIWSGLLVSFMLIAVALLSVIFLLDIHTMDKFDDPKGKMISITNE